MTKVKLTAVYINETDKNGNQFISREGKPYKKMSIKTEQHGDKYLSGFVNKANQNWKKGDEVEIVVKENGQYLNFEVPKLGSEVEILKTQIASLKFKVDILWEEKHGNTINSLKDEIEYPNDDIDPENIPF